MSTIKTNIIEPLGTAITISGAAHFTSGNAVLGGLTATNQINANGGLSVTGGATVYGDIEVYNGAFVRSGGLSVTGGIAGTLVTAAQPNITSLGTLSSLNVSAFGSGNIAPLPTSSSGVGQVVNINAASYTLPSGGTWFYFAFRWNTTSVQDSVSGIAAGGTLVCTFISGQTWEGFAWRIT